jgi:hypothetical protein
VFNLLSKDFTQFHFGVFTTFAFKGNFLVHSEFAFSGNGPPEKTDFLDKERVRLHQKQEICGVNHITHISSSQKSVYIIMSKMELQSAQKRFGYSL